MQQKMNNGRVYEIEAIETGKHTREHLLSRGFDGIVYQGVSRPIGRQKKTMYMMLYRILEDGSFVSAI